MALTFCNRCGDAVEEGCDPRDELAELDALLERLRLKRYDLKRKINQFHSPIVRQLPPDVTSTIFEFCLPDATLHEYPPFVGGLDFSFPLSLGAICSYWRDIAWSTPSLWSSLVFRDPRHREFNSHIITGIAQEWLARSGGLPLSIQFSSSFYNRTVLSLVDVINQYSTRWSNLGLHIPNRYYKHFHATDNHAPILKSIRFFWQSQAPGSVNAIARNLEFQLTCPSLERAALWRCPVGEINIQWDNLTHLTLHSMTIMDSFLILRKTPRLVFCEVSSFRLHHREQSIVGAPVLTSLRSLHLQTPSKDAEVFLDNLIAPHLEEFNFPSYRISRFKIKVVASFLRRSACSLRSLSIIFSILPRYFEFLMNLLQSMPSLTTLSILSINTLEISTLDDYDPRNILQLVAKVLSSQNASLQRGFLPNLKILEFTGELHLPPGNYDDLYPLPPTDNAVHRPLHLLKLDLHPTTRIPENMISYVSSLAERGVTVNVLSDSKDIFQSSLDYYRCRKDSLCRDWSDNLDSSLFS